jgi:hypothetical protein
MSVNTQKNVRVYAGPTGPTGNIQGVKIFPNFTGPTGTYKVCLQVNAAQEANGPTGWCKKVYPLASQGATGVTGVHPAIIILGYTGPA